MHQDCRAQNAIKASPKWNRLTWYCRANDQITKLRVKNLRMLNQLGGRVDPVNGFS
jgi:hypothetical protein